MANAVRLFALFLFIALGSLPGPARAQAGFEDDRVMLQGFYWESYRHGHPEKFPSYGAKTWYQIVKEQAPAIRAGRFDLIWLGAGVEPVADIVINHRDGSRGWADFKNPDWGTWAITRDDNAFTDRASEVFNTPLEERGAPEEKPIPYAQHGGTTYEYGSFRDIDHTNAQVRRDLIRYLLQLKSLGYRGWRYDMVHGYHARWMAVYNRASQPTFSVGEYDWDKQGEQRGWVWHTATTPNRLDTASSVFDFSTQFGLKDQIKASNYRALYGNGLGIGLVGDNTDGHAWKNRAVTFIENHDTGFRTNEDGTPQH
ncbi:MAG: alpha-amylase, partial [Rhodoplanes sp.]